MDLTIRIRKVGDLVFYFEKIPNGGLSFLPKKYFFEGNHCYGLIGCFDFAFRYYKQLRLMNDRELKYCLPERQIEFKNIEPWELKINNDEQTKIFRLDEKRAQKQQHTVI